MVVLASGRVTRPAICNIEAQLRFGPDSGGVSLAESAALLAGKEYHAAHRVSDDGRVVRLPPRGAARGGPGRAGGAPGKLSPLRGGGPIPGRPVGSRHHRLPSVRTERSPGGSDNAAGARRGVRDFG